MGSIWFGIIFVIIIAYIIIVCFQIIPDTVWGAFCCWKRRDQEYQNGMPLGPIPRRQGSFRMHFEQAAPRREALELFPGLPEEAPPKYEEVGVRELELAQDSRAIEEENRLNAQRKEAQGNEGQIHPKPFDEKQGVQMILNERRFAQMRFSPRLWSINEALNEAEEEL